MIEYADAEPVTEAPAEPSTALALIPPSPSSTDGPSYASGFEGISAAPFEDRVQTILLAPPEESEVLIRPDGIVYLPGVWYRRRLTKAFGAGGWGLAPRAEAKTLGDLVVYPGALFALGRYISEAVGECRYQPGNRNMSYASALEGARTDCLTRCCKDLLLASEMWDNEWRDRWIKKWAFKDGGSWKKVGSPKPADKPTTSAEPAPPPRTRPEPVPPPPMTADEFLSICANALETLSDAKFKAALALFKSPNPGEIPADRRAHFVTYLRKLYKEANS